MSVTATDVLGSLFNPTENVCFRVFDDKKSGVFKGAKLQCECGKYATIEETLKNHNALNRGILCVLYDTAARVSEICDLRVEDVRLDHPASVRITGKGRKVRTVPLLPTTAKNLRNYLAENHMLAPEKSHMPLFTNRDGKAFTRSGITYILNKYVSSASEIDASIPERITPHVMRHTKAMHLYEADQDLITVRDFLGHSDIKTTSIYARSSLEMKRKALEKISDSPTPEVPSWQQSKSTLEWLKSFGAQK